jgi:hypothetical protein
LQYVPTVVEDLCVSLAQGLGVMEECQWRNDWVPLSREMAKFHLKLPCSSAKGGLKMVTVSMVKEESGFATDLAALTAGAKLLNSYDGALSEAQAQAIYEDDQPEIILQAGGVDWGRYRDPVAQRTPASEQWPAGNVCALRGASDLCREPGRARRD